MRIKICGITRAPDAAAAARAGADFIGLNFYPPSPRYISEADLPALLNAVEPPAVPVAVTVNPKKRELDDLLARRTGLQPAKAIPVVQLHGEEPPALADWLAGRGIKVIKAFRVAGESFAAEVGDWLGKLVQPAGLLAVLLDTAPSRPGQFGGTGRRFNWKWIAQAREAGQMDGWPPLMLAGGLTPANVARAVQIAQPWGVDVAGGVEVEDSPGIKSLDKVRNFIRNARTAER